MKYKNVQKQGLIGVINIQEDFEKFAEDRFLSRYQNTMVISEAKKNFIEKLINVS